MTIHYVNPENAKILIDKYNISKHELMVMTGLSRATIDNYISKKTNAQKSTKVLMSNGIISIILWRNNILINERLLSINTYSTLIEVKSL